LPIKVWLWFVASLDLMPLRTTVWLWFVVILDFTPLRTTVWLWFEASLDLMRVPYNNMMFLLSREECGITHLCAIGAKTIPQISASGVRRKQI